MTSSISRRIFLIGTTGVAAAAALPAYARSSAPQDFTLVAAPGQVRLVGGAYPPTNVWCYDGRIPGPEIRVRQGEPVRIVVQNKLEQDTTVHWHGIRLPIAMDGVPGLTQ